jgi:hypothetical protein
MQNRTMHKRTTHNRSSIWTLGILAVVLSAAWGQDTSTPPATGASPQSGQQEPVPSYGDPNAQISVGDNPPLSGIDLPSLAPNVAPLSYIQPGATVSESADSNAGSVVGGSGFTSVTRALGSVTLKRLWSHYDLALDYIGGVGYYTLSGQGVKSLQQMDFVQKITWKRGELSLRDSFSYLPEGNFGGAYGSLGSQGIASLGNTAFGGFWGGSSLGNLGLTPRILNVALADVSENLTPKSTITAAGGYAFTHFYGDDDTGVSFIGSSQTSAQVGYDRILSSRTQVALIYGYQGYDFSVEGTAFHSNIIQGLYGHRISGRMDLLLGAGPQFTSINTQGFVCSDPTVPLLLCGPPDTANPTTFKSTSIGVAAQARLRYKFTKTMLDLSYRRIETSGSGLFAGAESDIVRLSATRPLNRVWTGFADIGYSHNDRLQPAAGGVDANTYVYGFAGAGVSRAFGRNFHGYASYQFNQLAFDNSYCGATVPCNRISNRNVVTVGLDWIPRPIRID